MKIGDFYNFENFNEFKIFKIFADFGNFLKICDFKIFWFLQFWKFWWIFKFSKFLAIFWKSAILKFLKICEIPICAIFENFNEFLNYTEFEWEYLCNKCKLDKSFRWWWRWWSYMLLGLSEYYSQSKIIIITAKDLC